MRNGWIGLNPNPGRYRAPREPKRSLNKHNTDAYGANWTTASSGDSWKGYAMWISSEDMKLFDKKLWKTSELCERVFLWDMWGISVRPDASYSANPSYSIPEHKSCSWEWSKFRHPSRSRGHALSDLRPTHTNKVIDSVYQPCSQATGEYIAHTSYRML